MKLACGFVDEPDGPACALRGVGKNYGQHQVLPTALPHSQASRPQAHRLSYKFLLFNNKKGAALTRRVLKYCLVNRTIGLLPKPDILAC